MGSFKKALKNFFLQLLIQSGWSERYQQRSGFLFVLSGITKKEVFLKKKKKIEEFNTNPYFASYITGMLLSPSGRYDRYSQSYYAAIGDELIWEMLRPFLLLFSLLLTLKFGIIGVLVFLLVYNFICQGIRFMGFAVGMSKKENRVFKEFLLYVKAVMLNLGIISAGMLFTVFLSFPYLATEMVKIFMLFVVIIILYLLKRSPSETLFFTILYMMIIQGML